MKITKKVRKVIRRVEAIRNKLPKDSTERKTVSAVLANIVSMFDGWEVK